MNREPRFPHNRSSRECACVATIGTAILVVPIPFYLTIMFTATFKMINLTIPYHFGVDESRLSFSVDLAPPMIDRSIVHGWAGGGKRERERGATGSVDRHLAAGDLSLSERQ